MARGNGKTALLSGIAAATLDGPLAVPRGETVIVASSFEQARIAFEHVVAFMAEKLEDRARWKIWDTAQQARIEDRKTGARVRCIGSDPRRAHGLAPVLVLADEPAQWPETTGERMVSALRTAAGKQPHSLPAMPDLLAAIVNEARQARQDPALLASFEALRLNLGTEDAAVSTLLDAGLWQAIEGESTRAGPCVWGIDLGTSAAQSAVACYHPQTGALASLAAFPAEPSLAERGLRDGVGNLYAECARRGELLTLGRHTVDVTALLQAALDQFGRPARIFADRWREADLREGLESAGVPLAALEFRGMGFRDGAEDVRGFRKACADRRVIPAPSLLLRSAMAEARTVSDLAGNAKLSKGSQGGRRVRARDDAAAAAILAVAAGVRQPTEPPRRWRYRGMAG